MTVEDAPAKKASRAGRNLPAAIGVGVFLAALVIGSLVFRKEAFLVVLAIALGVAVWEMRGALAKARIHVPLLPALIGAVAMVVGPYVGGGQALAVTLTLTCVGMLLWRVADGVHGAAMDIAGGMLVALYPCFLAGFAALMLAPDDGVQRLITFILVTVFSDIGGYAAGVWLGKHPMAPSVSPKKSWEGFAGSVLSCAVTGALAMVYLLHGPWWGGALMGCLVAATATIGDLVESTIKRDLGIKDMSSILPGHGGIMDRLDSLVVVAPMVWALLYWFVPTA
ncbi:phosphatidate cytidylyltransferase [Actinomycetota bacterium]